MDSDFPISASLVVVWWHMNGRESGMQVKEAAAALSPRGHHGGWTRPTTEGVAKSVLLTDDM